MATGLYIGSLLPFTGKNTLAVALGLHFQKKNLSVAYCKPVGTTSLECPGGLEDEDTLAVRAALGLDAQAAPSPVCHRNVDCTLQAFSRSMPDPLPRLQELYTSLSKRYDRVIVSGGNRLVAGQIFGLNGTRIAAALDLQAVLITRMDSDQHCDTLLHAKELYGERLLGVVLNAVPSGYKDHVTGVICPFLEKSGIHVLGCVPEDSSLQTLTIAQLLESLNTKLVTSAAKSSRSVSNFLIGTMQVNNFMTHFKRRPNVAVIVGGDRADVHMVAIEGGASCLILTGGLAPSDIILSRADSLGVPILVSRDDTYTVARKLEKMFSQTKQQDPEKIRQAANLLRAHVDMERLG